MPTLTFIRSHHNDNNAYSDSNNAEGIEVMWMYPLTKVKFPHYIMSCTNVLRFSGVDLEEHISQRPNCLSGLTLPNKIFYSTK